VIFRTPIAKGAGICLCALVHHPLSGGYAFFSFSVDNFSKYWELEMGRRAKTAGLRTLCALIFGVLIGSALAAQTTAISASSPASAAASATQVRLEDYYLLAISVSEGVAVLRGPDRHLTTLRVGTTLAPARARLAQVLGDRLRFDTFDDKGARQTAWMIRSANPEQLPQVQRVSGNPPTAPSMDAKSAVTVAPLSASPSTSK
jgi:hypothetical protein